MHKVFSLFQVFLISGELFHDYINREGAGSAGMTAGGARIEIREPKTAEC